MFLTKIKRDIKELQDEVLYIDYSFDIFGRVFNHKSPSVKERIQNLETAIKEARANIERVSENITVSINEINKRINLLAEANGFRYEDKTEHSFGWFKNKKNK